jgi:hypothetical protein
LKKDDREVKEEEIPITKGAGNCKINTVTCKLYEIF